MSATDPKSTIEAKGWIVEESYAFTELSNPEYRARLRTFFTPWRSSLAEVLEDVRKIKEPVKQ